MKQTFASYEHTTIGFPGVVLKWTVENGEISRPRMVWRGIVDLEGWQWERQYPLPYMDAELKAFDASVRRNYRDDISVQS